MAGPKDPPYICRPGLIRPGERSILVWERLRDAPLAAARVREDDKQLAGLGAKLDIAVALPLVRTLLQGHAKLRHRIGDCRRSISGLLQHTPGEVVEHGVQSRLARQLQREQKL